MATSLGGGPATLTLNPFHKHPGYQRDQQPRPPRITQQSPRPISTPQIASRRPPAYASSVSSTTSVSTVRGVAAAPIARPTVVQYPNAYRPPRIATTNHVPNVPTSPTRRTLPTHSQRPIVTTIAKVHAISPIQASSIDSVLHGDPSEAVKTKTVPDCIRPKAEAIDITSPMTPITLETPAAGKPITLYAHLDVLTKSSPVLQSMLKPPQSSQQQHKNVLRDIERKPLTIYINWLYTGKLHAGHRSDESPSKSCPEGYSGLSRLVQCYQAGVKLRDPHFQDAILDAIVTMVCACKKLGKTTLGLLMQRVSQNYAELPAGCKARPLFVHLFAHFGDWRLLDKSDSRAFKFETDEVIRRGAAADPTIAAAKCVFHEHDNGKCYRDV